MFQLLSTIPDYCSSNGCLVGQVQMSVPARKTQLSELPVRRTPGIPEQVRPPGRAAVHRPAHARAATSAARTEPPALAACRALCVRPRR